MMGSKASPLDNTRRQGQGSCPGPEGGPGSTPSQQPGQPPDYISIPEYLRNQPVAEVPMPGRVGRLLACANVRRLGDLDGKRLCEFEGHPGFAETTVWQLRCVILRALRPGVEPDVTTWPIPMRDYRPPGPAFAVSRGIRAFSPQDLPVSTRLRKVLHWLGIERLGQLDGLPVARLLQTRNCGQRTLEELKMLLCRAEAGEFGLPEAGGASRAGADPHPPDYIAIPEDLKSKPIESLNAKSAGGSRLPKRLRNLLEYAGIRLLGDLDGKRLADFEPYRGCGGETIEALRRMVLRELRPGVRAGPSMMPIRMRDWRPPEQTIEVSGAARDLRPEDLPVSVRLEGVLKGLGIKRLWQLDGLPFWKLRARPRMGRTTLAELRDLLRRAEAGEFKLSKLELASITPADLLHQIDEVVGALPESDRTLLARRFGATGQAPQTSFQIAQEDGVSRAWVYYRLDHVVRWLGRQGSLKMRARLDQVAGVCARSQVPLSPALVSTWQEPARPFRNTPQFYVGLIAKLRGRAGVHKGRRRAQQGIAP
jgi:hypothetical protein